MKEQDQIGLLILAITITFLFNKFTKEEKAEWNLN